MISFKSLFKRFWWVLLIFLFLVISIVVLLFSRDGEEIFKDVQKMGDSAYSNKLPDCPTDLSGLLTVSMVDIKYIASLTPLGNSNPPGHTFPVDHVYFEGYGAKGSWPRMPFYTPGDSIISKVMQEKAYDADGNHIHTTYAIDFNLCKGVKVVAAGESELMPQIQKLIDETKPECKSSKGKHDGQATITQCTYEIEYQSIAGEQVAWTGGDEIPEVWAFNYNIEPDKNVDWERYDYSDYPYAFCMFDLYSGDLKETLYSKFGIYTFKKYEDKELEEKKEAIFVPRTIAPICGSPHQNIYGTAQGDWFASNMGGMDSLEFAGDGLSLIHDNIDPRIGKIVIGGNFAETGILTFNPMFKGTINREFSSITPGDTKYCYQQGVNVDYGNYFDGIVILQLINEHNLKIERQSGDCKENMDFKEPYYYER